ncbi:hypothetical protein LWI29_002352 [Acer saccharum]|uniref:Uncharacterized protein n=1 Tax=Acer saccharum TaxID=4024 RepID=A0AA39VZZ2_ACESA|nr:hypothetical protein LWI29_002352 [Acer saccharum]
MAEEVHQKYEFIDTYDPIFRGPFITESESESPKHQYFDEYANQLKATEGFHVDLIPIPSVCCTWILPYDVNSKLTIVAANAAIKEFNRLKGADLQLFKLLNSNTKMTSRVLFFLTFQCSDGFFYEAKIYKGVIGDNELVMFRPSKFWPRKDKYTIEEEGSAEPAGSQIIGNKRKKKDKVTSKVGGAEPEGSPIIGKKRKSNQTKSLAEVRQKCYKVAVDADEGWQRNVEIRKSRILESLKKKQREGLQQQQQ